MKRAIFLVVVLLMVFSVMPASAETGNGAPSGPHFNLNLIGVKEGSNKTGDFGSGNRIFVPLDGQTDIMLREGDFAVLNGNGLTDDAQFQLPSPDPADPVWEGLNLDPTKLAYSVWIRPVAEAKKDAKISLTTCVTDVNDVTEQTETWCYVGLLSQNLTKSNTFKDVSKDLLQVCADVDPTAVVDLELVPLFDDANAEYFWHVDNDGMRNTQMRFYPLQQTTLMYGDCTQSPHPAHETEAGAASVLHR